MIFRLLEVRDYENYLKLINDFRKTYFTEHDFIERLSLIKSHGIEIYVLENEDKLIATATLIIEPKFIFDLATYAHIEDVCVDANRRREGLGLTIMKKILAICKQRQYYKVSLCCADQNIAFYEACSLEKRGNQMCQLIECLNNL